MTYVPTFIRTYNSHITLIIAWLLNWGEEDRKIVTSKTHFKLKMKQTDQKKSVLFGTRDVWGKKKWYSYRYTIKELKNLVQDLDEVTWFFFQTNFQNALFWVIWVFYTVFYRHFRIFQSHAVAKNRITRYDVRTTKSLIFSPLN